MFFEWIADRFYRWKYGRYRARERAWEAGPKAHGLYPAYQDWIGGFAVDATGDVWLSESPAEWGEPVRVEEPQFRHAALGVAVRRHKAIAHLTPERGVNDPICPTCGGRGYPAQLPPQHRYWILCQCGGLGWIPEGLVPPGGVVASGSGAPAP